MLPAPVQRGFLHSIFYHDYRYRLQDKDHRIRWETSEATDMGHGRAGTISNHYASILQGCNGDLARVRRHG